MTKRDDKPHGSTGDILRETLGYSVDFKGNTFCVLLDAESFQKYDCPQIAQDLLLVANSCNVKLIVFVGCFCANWTRAKNEFHSHSVLSVLRDLQKVFGSKACVVKPGLGDQEVFAKVTSALHKQLLVVIPLVESKAGKPSAVCDPQPILLGACKTNDLARSVAKLLIVYDSDGIFGARKELLQQLELQEAQRLVHREAVAGELADIVDIAVVAINQLGVRRVHVFNGTKPDALLHELFTKTGSGTMIYSGGYIDIRPATSSDANGIHNLVSSRSNGNSNGVDCCDSNIGEFLVAAIDGHVVACARLKHFVGGKSVVGSLVVNPEQTVLGLRLLSEAASISFQHKSDSLLLVAHGAIPWWIPQDFTDTPMAEMPEGAQKDFVGSKTVAILSKRL